MAVPEWMISDARARAHLRREASPGRVGTWPAWMPDPVIEAFAATGVEHPWLHQQQVAAALHGGHPTIVTTPTASGKSLGYLAPVVAATWGGEAPAPPDPCGALPFPEGARARFTWEARPHTALYLAPTKALAHDQWSVCRGLADAGLASWRTIAVDGDSDTDDRVWARDHAAYVLTNPDWVHAALLPAHTRWSGFLSTLRYVIVDEAHHYRGGFGAHVAMVLRRLLRVARQHGASPVVAMASATIGEPAAHVAALTGIDVDAVTVVSESTAPRGALDTVLWQGREHHDVESAAVTAQLVRRGSQALAFTSSRNGAERVAMAIQERTGQPVASYRGGHVDLDRREVEAGLRSGTVRAVAATSALELGVDITGLDAVVCSGHPGSLTSLWQRFGRAGRRGTDALAVLVAADDPLDTWLLDHPEVISGGVFEPVPVGLGNRSIVAAHLAAAAQEVPLTEEDLAPFGDQARELVNELVAARVLRARPTGWFWARPDRAVDAIALRSIGPGAVSVTDVTTGQVVATVDHSAADRTVHPGAVHLVQGVAWRVLDHVADSDVAWVEPAPPGVRTAAQSSGHVVVTSVESEASAGVGTTGMGAVRITEQVTGCLVFDEHSGDVIDHFAVERPVRTLETEGLWWELPGAIVAHAGGRVRFHAALHALEHVTSALLPGFIACDRSEVVAVADPGSTRLIVHDTVPGGGGFIPMLAPRAVDLMTAARDLIASCMCETGCPRCVVSARCPDHNDALDKAGAAWLATLLCPDQ